MGIAIPAGNGNRHKGENGSSNSNSKVIKPMTTAIATAMAFNGNRNTLRQ